MAALLWLGRISLFWLYLLIINAATFVAYAYDKVAAGGKGRRLREHVLHVLAALGGTPAAFVAQQVLRHKTRKVSFLRVFWLIAVVQAMLVGAWLYRSCR